MSGKDGAWKAAPAFLLLLAQPILFYRQALILKTFHVPFDFTGFHLPHVAYIAKCVRQGVFPFWDPYSYCGVPFHADPQGQLFYPLIWPTILLGNISAGRKLLYWLEWQVPLHMFLAGVFTYALLRQLKCRPGAALFGATVFQMGGFFASQAQHLGAISGAAWMPLAWLAILKLAERFSLRWLSILGLSLGMSFLAGFAPITAVVFLSTALLVGFLLLARRASGWLVAWLAAGILLAAALAAVQLIPTWQLVRWSVASHRGEWLETGGGLRPQALVSLLLPNYYHVFTPFDPSQYTLPINFTFLYLYCGIPALLLFACGLFFLRSTPFLTVSWICTVISALWMLGDSTPVYPFFYKHLPSLAQSALYADFAMAAFCLSLSLCAALVLNRVVPARFPFLAWAVALLAAVDLLAVSSGRPMNAHPGSWKKVTSEYNFAGSEEMLKIVRQLTGQANPPSRVDFTHSVNEWGSGANMLEVPTDNGDNPLAPRRLLQVRLLFSSGSPWERYYPVSRPDSPILDFLNVRYVFSMKPMEEETVRSLGFRRIENTLWINIYENPRVLSRFFLVNQLHAAGSEQEALALLSSKEFNIREAAVVENFHGLPPATEKTPGTVAVESYSPNRVELLVETTDASFLVTSESIYPGWKAELDGREVPLVETNLAFRGLPVPAGRHRIVMKYWPPFFACWAALSAAVALALVAGAAFPSRSSEQESSS